MFLLLAFLHVSLTAQEPLSITNWRMQPGDDLRWASPTFDDSSWANVPPPRPYRSGDPLLPGTQWYRATVTLPPQLCDQPFAIGMPALSEAYEVYANGQLAGRYGSWDPTPHGPLIRHASYGVPTPATPSLTVALRVWRGGAPANFAALQFFLEPMHPPELGPASSIRTLEQLHNSDKLGYGMANFAVSLILLLAGIASLSLFFTQRRNIENLWLAAVLFTECLPFLIGLAAALYNVEVRSVWTGLIVLLATGRRAAHTLFLASLSDRLRYPLFVVAAVQSVDALLRSFEVTTQILLPHFGSIERNLLNVVITLIVAALLFAQQRGIYAKILGIAVLLLASTNIVVPLGPQLNISPTAAAIAALVARTIFAVLALIGLHLKMRAEQARQAILDRDLSAARAIQDALITAGRTDTPPAFQVDAVYLPASEVGGDFYQTIPSDDGSLLLLVGDVSGKGLPASLLVAATVGALGGIPSRHPSAVLAHLNRSLHGKTHGAFVTCICALFHTIGTTEIANAGHLPPYSHSQELDIPAGLPLGLTPDADYPETSLPTFETLTFLSDGVVEAANRKGDLFGFDRTAALSAKPAKELAEAARTWGQTDDITVVTIRRTAA